MISGDEDSGSRACASGAPANDEKRICVAQVGAPHGLRGEVRLKTFTEDPLAIGSYGVLRAEDGRDFAIEAVRAAQDVLIVRFAGIPDRNAAEGLRNLRLYLPRSRLPTTGDADTFYHADLIGLAAVTAGGARLGTIAAVHNFGAGDLVEVLPEDGGPTVLLPFTKAVVPEVDVAAGRMVLDPPEGSFAPRDGASRLSRPVKRAEEANASRAGGQVDNAHATQRPLSRASAGPAQRKARLSPKGRG